MLLLLLLFLRRKKILGLVHKSVQNGANPYKQFFSQNTRTKTTKVGVDENRKMNNFNNTTLD